MYRAKMVLVLIALTLGFGVFGCSPSEVSEVSEDAVESEPVVPMADIYDEGLDGSEQIAGAMERARAENKHVLITWGGDWCSHCRNLARVFKSDEAIRSILDAEYVSIKIDVGEREKHMALALEYGADIEVLSIPHMTVLNVDGKVAGEITPEDYVDDDADYLEQFHPEVIAARLAALAKAD